MDYESDSSDFHFPEDTGLAKLSSPLSFKVPESRDWALDEFMQTLSEKPHMETDNLTSFKHYLPVSESEEQEEDFYTSGPPKLTLPTYEEKDFLTQISQHFIDLERKELHDILKGGFNLVQNDIQTNTSTNNLPGASPFASAHPDISWFDEAFDYGHQRSVGISNLENVDFRRSPNRYSPFDQQQMYNGSSILHTNSSIILSEDEFDVDDELDVPAPVINSRAAPVETTTPVTVKEKINNTVVTQQQQIVSPIEYHKPLPALPLTVTTTSQPPSKKKGLKYKLQSKLSKMSLLVNKKESKKTLFTQSTAQQAPVTTTSKKQQPLFLQKSKKFIRKMFSSKEQQ